MDIAAECNSFAARSAELGDRINVLKGEAENIRNDAATLGAEVLSFSDQVKTVRPDLPPEFFEALDVMRKALIELADQRLVN